MGDFAVATFAAGDFAHKGYRKGTGADVLFTHELPA
jgi:hypothetical protein